MSALDKNWLRQVEDKTCGFLGRLRVGDAPGRFLPCEHGVTEVGREMGLGFSTFALRTLRMFGQWDLLPGAQQQAWALYISNFQEHNGEGGFRDEAELRYVARENTGWSRWKRRLLRRPGLPGEEPLILAETKQALATLHEIGIESARPFSGFPQTPEAVRAWLEALDWRRPWGAGGQSGALIVFLKTQAPRVLPREQVEPLLQVCRDFFATLADRETGAYFRGPRPEHGELINGAMKVLMSLHWLQVRPHYAEQLIQTTLADPPSSQGCHLVDAIYVLHQSVAAEASDEVKDFCLRVVEQVRDHYYPTGGFSFFVGRSQNSYYGVPITKGGAEPDIQGTCLLVWALAMIWRLMEPTHARWGVIKP